MKSGVNEREREKERVNGGTKSGSEQRERVGVNRGREGKREKEEGRERK